MSKVKAIFWLLLKKHPFTGLTQCLLPVILPLTAAYNNSSPPREVSASRLVKNQLYTELLAHQVLKHGASPSVDLLLVHIDYRVYHISKVSESEQLFSCVTFITLWWQDPDLTWREEDYNGVRKAYLPTDR